MSGQVLTPGGTTGVSVSGIDGLSVTISQLMNQSECARKQVDVITADPDCSDYLARRSDLRVLLGCVRDNFDMACQFLENAMDRI